MATTMNRFVSLHGPLCLPRVSALLIVLLCQAVLGVSWATTIYVNASSQCPGTGTLSNPYRTIQDAICRSTAGDLVLVAPGTYNESIRMKPGVSVLSMAGYAVTTINGTGKVCTRGASIPPNPIPGGDYCIAQPYSLQCSTVVIGEGFTNSDRIDGFTITGGKGINRGSVYQPKIAGGGLFVFSSPTISNNLIQGNIVQGPRPYYSGGGLYLISATPATPVITKNTIDGNRVVTIPGVVYANFSLGGALYAGPGSYPTISKNIITNNIAGQVTNANTIGNGAGIAVYNNGNGPEVRITQNLISGNIARDFAGAVYLGSYYVPQSLHPSIKIDNNEIRNNISALGGGISAFYVTARIVNNTIVGNSAYEGGGIYVDKGGASDSVIISNNLITGNTADDLIAGGGGLYVDVTLPHVPLTIRNNDFFGNNPSSKQVGGLRSDANTIGFDRNINVNPSYKNPAQNDYHLGSSSAVREVGNNPDVSTIPTDADGLPRIMDSNTGLPGSDVDLGEYEYLSATQDSDADGSPDLGVDRCPLDPLNDQDNDGICVGNAFNPPKTGKNDNCPTAANTGQANTDGDQFGNQCDPCNADVLNDVDNDGVCVGAGFSFPKVDDQDNCPSASNLNQLDTDSDGVGDACDNCSGASNSSQANLDCDALGDACDGDDDGDGTLDVSDCAPQSPSVSSPPLPVGSSVLFAAPTILSWTRVPFSHGNTYNVYRGSFGSSGMHGTFNHTCFEEDSPDTLSTDTAVPSVGGTRYYLVSARNRCGESNLGTQSNSTVRPLGTPCSLVIRDTDADGLADVDDNCASVWNRFQEDAEGDGIGNACDVDSDNDGVSDGNDCAPYNPSEFAAPVIINTVVVTKLTPTTTQIAWTFPFGSTTNFDVATGRGSDMRGPSHFGPGTCLGSNLTTASKTDSRPNPPAGDMYYYLVRAQNICGNGSYGSDLSDAHGSSGGASCP